MHSRIPVALGLCVIALSQVRGPVSELAPSTSFIANESR